MSGTEPNCVVKPDRGTYPFRHSVSRVLTSHWKTSELKIVTDYQVRLGDRCWNERQENYINLHLTANSKDIRKGEPYVYIFANLSFVRSPYHFPTVQDLLENSDWENQIRKLFEFEPTSKTEMLVIVANVGNQYFLIPWKSNGEFGNPELIMEDNPIYIEASWKPEDFLTEENKQ